MFVSICEAMEDVLHHLDRIYRVTSTCGDAWKRIEQTHKDINGDDDAKAIIAIKETQIANLKKKLARAGLSTVKMRRRKVARPA